MCETIASAYPLCVLQPALLFEPIQRDEYRLLKVLPWKLAQNLFVHLAGDIVLKTMSEATPMVSRLRQVPQRLQTMEEPALTVTTQQHVSIA